MLRKATVIAILIALVLASFPTFGVFAKSEVNAKLEKRWEEIVTTFNNQNYNHMTMHNLVDNWFSTHKSAKASEKAAINRHLAICNSAFESAQAIVANHAGFDRDGKVIDRALAQKSIKDLAYYLRQHAGSVKSLREHIK